MQNCNEISTMKYTKTETETILYILVTVCQKINIFIYIMFDFLLPQVTTMPQTRYGRGFARNRLVTTSYHIGYHILPQIANLHYVCNLLVTVPP